MSKTLSSSVTYPLDPTNLKETITNFYKGKHYKELPTPALVIKEHVVDSNIQRLFESIDKCNESLETKIKYRAHIKTHKTIEGTLKQLGHNVEGYSGKKYSSIVVSTLREAYLVSDYQEKTNKVIVDDVVYGLPVGVPSIIPDLFEISKKFKRFTIFVDNPIHFDFLKDFITENKDLIPENFKWSVYIKIDMGTHRAGVYHEKDLIRLLEKLVESKDFIDLYGFYAHGGHSYNAKTLEESEDVLIDEINSVNKACTTLFGLEPSFANIKLTLSVGASPTIRSFQKSKGQAWVKSMNNLKGSLEIHAGNYLISDLQQCSTGTITEAEISSFILGTVISQYPGRNTEIGEMLINTGVLAMTKETSHKFVGFGQLPSDSEFGVWYLNRLSQEHGILQPLSDDCKMIPIGSKIEILMQHVCINMACFGFFYVVDKEGMITDVWIPCRGW